jgi:transposase
LPLIDHVVRRMRLREFLAGYLPRPDSRSLIKPVDGLLVLLKNVLLGREPIYGVGEWASEHAPDLLGLTGEQVLSLNDDRVGRCLDRLFDGDRPSLVLAVTAHVVKEFAVALDELHNDSTTVTLFGRYEDAKPGRTKRMKATRAITWGYNKDHRPDLKQLLFTLTVSADGGVPIHFEVADGNVTDDQTHRRTWDLLCELTGRRDFLYVADSKLAAAKNMDYIVRRGGRFITVMPRTRKEDGYFRKRMRQGPVAWQVVHTKTKKLRDREDVVDVVKTTVPTQTTAEGYNLFWYHSTRKEELDRIARANRLNRSMRGLATLQRKLASPKSRHRDKAKVLGAIEKILKPLAATELWHVTLDEVEQDRYRQARPGRPGKNTQYVKKTTRRLALTFEINHDAIQDEARSDGIFPLISSDPALSAVDVYLAYKRQPSVEVRFSQLKSEFAVAPVFLKEAARVEALLCIYYLALLVQALIAREVRVRMAEKEIESLPLYPEARPCTAPSAPRIFDLFENIQRHHLTEKGKLTRTFLTELSPLQARVLKLLGISPDLFGLHRK